MPTPTCPECTHERTVHSYDEGCEVTTTGPDGQEYVCTCGVLKGQITDDGRCISSFDDGYPTTTEQHSATPAVTASVWVPGWYVLDVTISTGDGKTVHVSGPAAYLSAPPTAEDLRITGVSTMLIHRNTKQEGA